MVRPPPIAVLVSLLAFTLGCGEGEAPYVDPTRVTTNETSPGPGTGSTSSTGGGSSTSGASEGGTTTTSGGSLTGTTGAVDTTTGATTTTSGGSSTGPDSTSTTELDPVQECLAKVDPGDECTACTCVHCLELWEACALDERCWLLQQCAQKEGCYGANCLFIGVCQAWIDYAGGTHGDSFKRWLEMSDCLQPPCQHMCPW